MRFLIIALAAAATLTAQSPLTTTFADNNGQDGNMFDVVATNAAGVTIRSFDINCDAGTFDFEVYKLTIPGPYANSVNTPGDWTLVGSATGVVGQGNGVPTQLPICVEEYIPAGATQSFYVTGTQNLFPINYTNGTATGALYASNADLEFYEGAGLQYPFTQNFNPRIFNGNIYYDIGNTVGAGCSFASVSTYGAGCGVVGYASVYEQQPSATMDLDGLMVTGLSLGQGAGYLVQVMPGAGGIAQGPNAQVMALGDDDFQDSAIAGGTLGVWVGSNCNIALGGANSAGFVPDVGVMLNDTFEGLYAWTDMHSSSGGGVGDIYYEENGTEAIVTYLGVAGWNTMLPNTVQFKWDTATGNWSIEFENLNLTNPEDWLVGYSPAGPNLDPGATDLSALNGGGVLITEGFDSSALELSGNRPLLGTNWDLTTNYIDTVSPFALTFFGDATATPIPFTAIGLNAPGCDVNLLTAFAEIVSIQTAGTATASLPIPNNPALAGTQLSAQSLCLTLGNVANIYSSNGVTGTLGN